MFYSSQNLNPIGQYQDLKIWEIKAKRLLFSEMLRRGLSIALPH